MALRKIYKRSEDSGPVTAYFRVNECRYSYEKLKDQTAEQHVVFGVEAFVDGTEEHIRDNNWETEGCGFHSLPAVPDTAPSTLTQKAYEHLKTLDVFAEAEDC